MLKIPGTVHYRVLKYCISLLENTSLRIPTRNVECSEVVVFVALISIVLLLDAPMIPAWRWV
jgi:hypothetical protein